MIWFIMLPLAALGIVGYRAVERKKALDCLDELLFGAKYLSERITLSLEPLGEVFSSLGEKCPLRRELFKELELAARRGGELEKCLDFAGELSELDEGDRLLWSVFLSRVGREEYQSQVTQCNEFVKSFEERVERKRTAMKKSLFSETALGITAGLFIALLAL